MDLGPPTTLRISPLTSPIAAMASPDHAMLVAGIAVRQAGTYTATLAERMGVPQARGDMRGALVAMFVAGDEREAAALRGSFHPRIAQASRTPGPPANAAITVKRNGVAYSIMSDTVGGTIRAPASFRY